MVAVWGPMGSTAFRAVARQEHHGRKKQWRETTPVEASRKWRFWKGPETSYSLQRHTLSGPLPPRKIPPPDFHPFPGMPQVISSMGGGAVNALVNISILMITVALPKPASGLRLHHVRAFLLEGGECQAQTITQQEDERTKGTLAVLQNSFLETGEWLSW